MLVLVRAAMGKHVDLPVNWLGRAGVFPVFGALFFGLAGVDWLAQALLYVGLVADLRIARAVRQGRPAAVSCAAGVSGACNPHPQLEDRYAPSSMTQERTART